MANTSQSKKRARQNKKHWLRNISLRSAYRTSLKKALKAIESGSKEAALAAYTLAVPIIDRMVNKGIIHRNKAARHKSRLVKQIKELV